MDKTDIIYLFGTYSWGRLMRRPEHLSLEFSKRGHRVLFIEYPFGLTSIFDIFKPLGKELLIDRFKKGRIIKINENLWVYKTPILYQGIFHIIGKFNAFLVTFLLKRLVKRLNFKQPILWLCHDDGINYIGKFNESLVCWDSMDEETGWTEDPKKQVKIRERVEKLAKNVDIIFTSSRGLYEDKKTLNPNTYPIPNAVDYDHFIREVTPGEMPGELRCIKGPVLGFVGLLANWVDIDLIKYIANHNRNWQVVLIGISIIDVSDITRLDNIHFLGKKDYKLIPNYIRYFDVCLLPFKVDRLTDAVNPIKMYEYLALGKPVVATNTAEMKYYGNLIYAARDKEEFVSKIKEALSENDNQKVYLRKEFAKQNVWSQRVDEILNIIQTKTATKI